MPDHRLLTDAALCAIANDWRTETPEVYANHVMPLLGHIEAMEEISNGLLFALRSLMEHRWICGDCWCLEASEGNAHPSLCEACMARAVIAEYEGAKQ